MKYFYIITFDGQIFEIKYSEQKHTLAMEGWRKGDILMFSELEGGIHASSISKILNEENYESYVFSVKPKLFIKDGTWFDGKERKIVRYEPWKQKEIDERKQLNEGDEPELSKEEIQSFLKKYKPDFIKEESKLLTNKMKV